MDGTSSARPQPRHTREVATEILPTPPQTPPQAPPQRVPTEVLPPRRSSASGSPNARFAQVGRAGRVYEVGHNGALRDDPIKSALQDGFQLVSGIPFPDAARLLARAGEGGLAVASLLGATREGVDELKRSGVLAVAHAKRAHEAAEAASKGFAGALLDAARARTHDDAEGIKQLVETARATSTNATFAAVLRGGERLVMACPWLVENGFVCALLHEGLSYRVGGRRTSPNDRKVVDARWRSVRSRFPLLPLICVDHPRNRERIEKARARARQLGFDVSLCAVDDGQHKKLSAFTAVALREDDPTIPLIVG